MLGRIPTRQEMDGAFPIFELEDCPLRIVVHGDGQSKDEVDHLALAIVVRM